MVSRYCVNESYTIKEVLEQFESQNDRVAIVIDDNERVVGVVSQGDILRALSAGADLYIPIRKITRCEFIHQYERKMREAYLIFKNKKITVLPIINHENKLVDVITLDDIFAYLEIMGTNEE